MRSALLVAIGLLVSVIPARAQTTPTPPAIICAMAGASISTVKLKCAAPAAFGLVPGPAGPAGTNGTNGTNGATGPAGPAGPAVTGGPCANADGTPGFFALLPAGGCLPILFSGTVVVPSVGFLDQNNQPIPAGTAVAINGLNFSAFSTIAGNGYVDQNGQPLAPGTQAMIVGVNLAPAPNCPAGSTGCSGNVTNGQLQAVLKAVTAP